ncbi:glycosyltransferase family 39 protein [Pseudoduganella sp. OTU4001]|uniref:glycosyltransferase family 39 protein n=1 Tax=Pseudoduganella sp. OTU4001 TaxID=3043854 RepID=UPI00313B59A1
MVNRTLHALAFALTGLMAAGVLLSTPLFAWTMLRGNITATAFAASALLALAVAAAVVAGRARLLALLRRAAGAGAAWPARRWLLLMLVAGLALRLLFYFAFPAQPSSDGAVYLGLARKLANGETYGSDGALAFWPPGYPFFLLPWVAAALPLKFIPVLSNLLLFALTLPVVWRLAERLAGPAAARLATVLLTLWPNYVTNVATPEKENLLIFLLPAVVLLYCTSTRAWPRLLAGLLLGFGALTQPSLLLFPSVLLCFELFQNNGWRRVLLHLTLLMAGMAAVIAPWTARNMAVFGEVVVVTANGGDVLYRANNPMATGGFTPRGEVDLSNLGELERNRMGAKLAKEWIVSHPMQFAGLVLTKQMLFLGDDSVGVYASMRRSGMASDTTILLFKGLANGFWYALWAILLMLCWQRLRLQSPPVNALESALMLSYAYFFSLHSVFESNGKYHVPALALLAVLAASMVVRGLAVHDTATAVQRPAN